MYIEDDEDLLALLDGPVEPKELPHLAQIHEGVADYAASFKLLNRYDRGNPHHALGFATGQWFETTEEVYWYFLECLPPLYMGAGGFVMCECTKGDLYESFLNIDGRYFNLTVSWPGPREFSALSWALLNEVRS